MKNLYAFLVLSLVGTSVVKAQSLELVEPVSQAIYDENTNIVDVHWDVRNTSDQPLEVRVQRTNLTTIDGSLNYFCWELCYTPPVSISPTSLTIEPGESVPNFIGYYEPWGTTGISEIEYCFFNEEDSDDRICMVVTYTDQVVSVREVEKDALRIYPNPANDRVTIDLGALRSSATSLEVYNLLGAQVYRTAVSSGERQIELSTQELPAGIYIVQVAAGSKLAHTGRLIVNH